MYEAGAQMQSEAYRFVGSMIDNAVKGRVEYRKTVEEGFKKVEGLL